MPAHAKEVSTKPESHVSTANFLAHPLPKQKFPMHETDPTPAYQLVHDQLLLDGNLSAVISPPFVRHGWSQRFTS